MLVSFEPDIRGIIEADDVSIGKGVIIEENVLITGKSGSAKRVVLGDFSYIGKDTRIIIPEFSLGDYSKLNAFSFAHGIKPLQIGRNCWIGGNTVLDSIGGLDIDDNVGIGAHSQIWTHIKFGDIVEGCRFNTTKYMHIQKDVWFVGHCIVSPVIVGERSMAMVGSVITKDMLPNHIYGGVPAIDLTGKIGNQFESRSIEKKYKILKNLIDEFSIEYPEYKGKIIAIRHPDDEIDGISCFDVSTRTYTQNYSKAEVTFLKKYVPLVKFTPKNSQPFIKLRK